MAGLFSGSMKRADLEEEDILGFKKSVGMFDDAFASMGRAPVDELWAGKNSAAINDYEFKKDRLRARNNLNIYLQKSGDFEPTIFRDDEEKKPRREQAQGSKQDHQLRDMVSQRTGLHIYPGQVVGPHSVSPEEMTFMKEFSDQGARLRDGWRSFRAIPNTLGELLEHDELYKHYPEIRNLPLDIEDMGNPRRLGAYGGRSSDDPLGRMKINKLSDDETILDTIIHEAQHYIQGIEGWGGGGAVGEHSEEAFKKAYPDLYDNFIGWLAEQTQTGDMTQDKLDSMIRNFGYEAYQNIDGEILARDASNRRHLPPAIANTVHEDRRGLLGKDVYPIRTAGMKASEGTGFPHEMPKSLFDEVAHLGQLEKALQYRKWASNSDPYANEGSIFYIGDQKRKAIKRLNESRR